MPVIILYYFWCFHSSLDSTVSSCALSFCSNAGWIILVCQTMCKPFYWCSDYLPLSSTAAKQWALRMFLFLTVPLVCNTLWQCRIIVHMMEQCCVHSTVRAPADPSADDDVPSIGAPVVSSALWRVINWSTCWSVSWRWRAINWSTVWSVSAVTCQLEHLLIRQRGDAPSIRSAFTPDQLTVQNIRWSAPFDMWSARLSNFPLLCLPRTHLIYRS